MEGISREKIATGFLNITAALRAAVNTKAVLPIPGRAAMITRSEFCQPPVARSNSTNPVATPVIPSFISFLERISSIESRTKFFISTTLRPMFLSAMENMAVSVRSRSSNTSVESSYESRTAMVAAEINSRLIKCSNTIREWISR